jgi:hypothetical protein
LEQAVALLTTLALAIIDAGAVIVTLPIAVHPLLSVTVIVYPPAANPVAVAFVCPPVHEYVYGVLPPLGLDVALPLLEHAVALLTTLAFATTAAGAVMEMLPVAVQPLLSVTVIV